MPHAAVTRWCLTPRHVPHSRPCSVCVCVCVCVSMCLVLRVLLLLFLVRDSSLLCLIAVFAVSPYCLVCLIAVFGPQAARQEYLDSQEIMLK